ncbi:MAG: class I SAM-dependent methyltransferase [Planctomycetaceae bacterium]|nr:class I SAM-dependent methyltransferase [Planctomycetaceae bacterium]
MTSTTKTECPVCGPAATSAVGVCHEQPVVACTQCGLLFVGECQTVEDTEEFFRSEHVDSEELTAMHYVTFRKDSLEREAAVIQRLYPEGGRLLDVGTASGYFLREFADVSGWEPVGVEPSAVSTRFARQEFGLDVREGYLQEQQFAAESFDVVTSLDAFNCHREPNEDLAEIHRVLKPGGTFAIEIPGQSYRMLTGSGPLCRLLFGCSLRLNAGVNFYFYTTQALVTMAQRAGFVLQDAYPESTPVQGRLVSRLAKSAYFTATSLLYRLTGGRVHYAPKEYLIFRKPAAAKPAWQQAPAEPRAAA